MSGPNLVGTIIESIKSVTGPGDFSLHEPSFNGNEWKYVKDCIDSGWVSSVGQYVDRFEKDIAEFTGALYVVATSNGTSALHLCLLLAGVRPGDEVLIPTLSFIGTANAVSYCGAIPHFVDSDEMTLGLDCRKLGKYLAQIGKVEGADLVNKNTGKRISAIVPMHTFGHPVDLDSLEAICNEFKIPMIEDAAESLGSYYKGKHTGTRGLLSALSFNGNKIITTGGGGAILTKDKELARKAKHLSTTAKVSHPWKFEHDEVGFNYRLPNLNAALGCAQIEQLPEFLKLKRNLALKYKNIFEGTKGVHFFSEPEFGKSNYWLNVILLDSGHIYLRDEVLERANTAGIKLRGAWNLLHTSKMYRNAPRMDISCAENLLSRIINLPSSPKLGNLN